MSQLTRRRFLTDLVRLAGAAALLGPAAPALAAPAPWLLPPGAGKPAPYPTLTGRQPGATLRVAVPFGLRGLDPAIGFDGYSIMTYGLGETLQRVTPAGEVVPWLAESVEALDPLRWRVRLRDGIAFWNGRALDAPRLKASLMRSIERNPSAANLLQLSTIDVVDSRTVELATTRPNGALGANLSSSFLVVHDPAESSTVDGLPAPALTGPFRPVQLRPGELCTVARMDGYWGGAPALAGAEFRGVSDGNARLLGALAGDVDLSRQIPPSGVGAARAGGLAVASSTSGYMYHLYLNCRKPPFDDVQVRRALSLAVDRRSLAERVLGGSGEVATGPFPRFYPFAAAEEPRFDPAAARELLDAAGWLPGRDGVRERSGRQLAFTILTYPQRPELGLLATAIQAGLREIGVAAAIRSTEDISTPVDNGEHEAAMYAMQTVPTADPGFIFNLIYRSSTSLASSSRSTRRSNRSEA